MSMLCVALLVGLFWALLFITSRLFVWILFFLTLTVICAVNNQAGGCGYLLLAVPLLLLTAFALRPLRAKYITKALYGPFKKLLPAISKTEQAALDAGDIWWEGDLFRGLPDWQRLFNLPEHPLTAEEQLFVDKQTNEFCHKIDNWSLNHGKMDMSDEAWAYLRQEKFFGLIIPKRYGGLGFSARAHSDIISKVASRSISAAVTVMVPNSLGPAELLLKYGTDAQKEHYLPKLATGEEMPCFALTGPEAGSDAGAMPDTGVVCYQEHEGEQTLGIRLNFDKRYITLAPVATVMGLAFKLFDPDNHLGEQKALGITLALIPTSHPGIEIGARHIPASSAFMNGPIRGKDVFIPMAWIIGGQTRIGQGWRMLMECLAAGRGISLPALSYAATLQSYRSTSAYAMVREQFQVPLAQFEGIQTELGKLGALAYLQQAVRTFTVSAIDDGYNPAVTTAITKYHLTELGRAAVIAGMDIQAGKAIMNGPKNYLAAFYQTIPVAITVEGANILTRNLIIFGQGAIRCHPYLTDEIAALNHENPAEGVKIFDKLLFTHIGYTVNNLVRALTLALTQGWYSPRQLFIERDIRSYCRHLSRYSTALAFISDVALLVLGGNLKRQENLSARLGDVLSQLYLASAVMRYAKKRGLKSEEKPYLDWVLQDCLYKIQEAFRGFLKNFPNRPIAYLLKALLFPLGMCRQKPKDSLTEEISQQLSKSSAIRADLLTGIFLSTDDSDAMKELENAYLAKLELADVLKVLQSARRAGKISKQDDMPTQLAKAQAQGLISEQDVSDCLQYNELRQSVIAVDEFSEQFFK